MSSSSNGDVATTASRLGSVLTAAVWRLVVFADDLASAVDDFPKAVDDAVKRVVGKFVFDVSDDVIRPTDDVIDAAGVTSPRL